MRHEVGRRRHVQAQRAIRGAVDPGGEPGRRGRVGEGDDPDRAAADARCAAGRRRWSPASPRPAAARAGPGAAASGATARPPGRGPSAACRARPRRRRRGSGTRPRSAPSSLQVVSRPPVGPERSDSDVDEALQLPRGEGGARDDRRGRARARAGMSKATGLLPLSRSSTWRRAGSGGRVAAEAARHRRNRPSSRWRTRPSGPRAARRRARARSPSARRLPTASATARLPDSPPSTSAPRRRRRSVLDPDLERALRDRGAARAARRKHREPERRQQPLLHVVNASCACSAHRCLGGVSLPPNRSRSQRSPNRRKDGARCQTTS